VYLFEFIEVFYNRQRHQEALDHMAPVEYAATFIPAGGSRHPTLLVVKCPVDSSFRRAGRCGRVRPRPLGLRLGKRGWWNWGQLWRSSSMVMASSQEGQCPPTPRRRMKLPQSQRWVPRSRVSQSGHW
ncbi:MAG: hypothetical protein ACRDHS_10685, partial [Actinomycetota bacterium]